MATTLQPGQKAPVFSGLNQNGDTVTLSQLKGKKLALYFYPQDGTPTCTVQACNLRDNFSLLQQQGITVIGVSPDGIEKHKKFEEKHGLPFHLIADPQHKILNKYGVWAQKKMFGNTYMGVHRTTFLIDEKGMIKKIFTRPKSADHAREIIDSF